MRTTTQVFMLFYGVVGCLRLDPSEVRFHARGICVDVGFGLSGRKFSGNSCLANSSILIAVMRKPCFGMAARFKLSQSGNRERNSRDAGLNGLPYGTNDGVPHFFYCHH